MKILVLKLISIIFLLFFLWSCGDDTTFDLAILDVDVFDSENKQVFENKTILINSDTIASIVDANTQVSALKIIQGNKRLVCPGFIDQNRASKKTILN